MHAGEYSIKKNTLVEQSYQGRLLERGVVILLFEDGADQRQGQCTYIAKELTTALSYLLQWSGRARKALEKFLRSSNPSL